jgi:aspartate kinase
MKFGGTSVKDSASIANVIHIVRNKRAHKIVVVSAIADATNVLEKCGHLSAGGKVTEAKKLIEELINRHYVIINDLIRNEDLRHSANEKIINNHLKIEELITGLAIIRELTLRTLDAFRVFGEILSSAVIYYAMKDAGINVELFDSRDVIKTDNEFSRAYPDFELTKKNIDKLILPVLKKGRTVLVQGFIASTSDGIPATMGRESSDFSAAIYGALANADEIQIWTDVDGVLTADPNLIPDAFKLSEISFLEMEELSNFGAKVLHKNSIKPALEKNIPLRILNSKNISSTGTLIHSGLSFPSLLKSITYKKNIMVLRLKPKDGFSQYIFWEMLLGILGKHKPQIDILVSSNNAIIIVIAENNYTKIHYDDLQNEFNEISDYKQIKDKALITLVGADLYSVTNIEQRIFKANPKLKAESIIFGYNPHSFTLLINAKDMVPVLQKLHREFFGTLKNSPKLFQRTKTKS